LGAASAHQLQEAAVTAILQILALGLDLGLSQGAGVPR
jgi:hypothetical protein